MTQPNDPVIAHARVKIHPDLSGFGREMRQQIRRDMASDDAMAQAKAAAANMTRIRANYFRQTFQQTRNFNEQVQRAEGQAYNTRFSRLRSFNEGVARDELAAYNARFSRARDFNEKVTHEIGKAQTAALAEEKSRNKQAADDYTKSMRQRQAASRAAWGSLKPPQIIDWGAKGIRPMNLLYLSVAALSPALIAMGSSAVQASSSVAALGAAGIGAATGLAALFGAFTNVFAALKQANTSRLQHLRKQANLGIAGDSLKARTRDNRDAIVNAEAAVADAQRSALRAQDDLNRARVQARQDLIDLRREVHNLATEETGASLDLTEARRKQTETDNNFFATALERAQAAQSVREAEDRLANTHAERTAKTKELHSVESKGIGSTDQVRTALERVADAQRSVADAQRSLTQAREKNTTAALKQAAALDKLSQSDATLADLEARMSKEGRALFEYLNGPATDAIWAFQRRMEKAVDPGVLQMLKDLGLTSKKDTTAFGLFSKSAENLGKTMGYAARRTGQISETKWFRGDLATINKENEKSFRHLVDAALALVKPLMDIMAAAAPLGTRFSAYLETLATKFADFIEQARKTGALKKWFTDAGNALRDWWDIAVDLGRIVLAVFQASLPTGDNLVSRLKAFTDHLADLAENRDGFGTLQRFFGFFKNLNYGDLAQTAGSLIELAGAVKAFQFGAKHPFFLAMGFLAAGFPGTTVTVIEGVTSAFNGLFGLMNKYPKTSATLLAVLAGYQGLSKISKLPGLDKLLPQKLLNIFGDRGTTPANPLFVKDISGGLLPNGGPAAKTGLTSILTSAPFAVIVATAAASIASDVAGWRNGQQGQTPQSALGDALKHPGVGSITKALATETVGQLPNQVSLLFRDGISGWAKQNQQDSKQFLKGLWNVLTGHKPDAKPTPRPLGAPPVGPHGELWGQVDWTAPGTAKQAWQQTAMGNLQHELALGPRTHTAEKKSALAAWVAARKAAVKEYVDYIRSKYGPVAAEQALETENKRSEDTLKALSGQVGLTTGDFKKYGTQIRLTPKEAKTDVKTPGLKPALKDFETLKTKIDPVTGVKTITLKVNDTTAVFKTLADAVIFQNALQKGIPVAESRRLYKKEERLGAATGGPIRGFSPHPKADNIPTWLTADEFVQPVDAVRHYGLGFMEAVRTKRFPRLAQGGQPGAWPFPVDVSKTKIPQSPLGVGEITGDLDVARIAEATARGLHASEKQLIALFEAGLVESGMRNLAYGDRDSVGFLQQRPSQGWGSVAQLRNVAYATRKFINAAKRKDHKNQTSGMLAQAVQVSAFPDRYDQRYLDAITLLNMAPPYVAGGGFAGLGTAVGGRGWRWQEAVLSAAFGKRVQFYSTTGGHHAKNSLHYKGRALDLTPSMEIFNWIKQRYGASTLELIYGPAGIGIKNGRPYNYGKALNAQHMNHVHWAYATGGRVGVPPRPAARPWLADPSTWQGLQQRKWNWEDYQSALSTHKADQQRAKAHELHLLHLKHLAHLKHGKKKTVHAYDSGGVLKPGVTVAVNNTGKPETVRTYEQERALNDRYQRIDRRDLALLAAYIANAIAGQHIKMDGRKVAETVRGYDYLPRGI